MFNDEMLKVLVRLTSLFFDLLENYSQGKTLNIKTNKLLKKKAKKQFNSIILYSRKKKEKDLNENEEFNEENPE